jgi:hypothetical protein
MRRLDTDGRCARDPHDRVRLKETTRVDLHPAIREGVPGVERRTPDPLGRVRLVVRQQARQPVACEVGLPVRGQLLHGQDVHVVRTGKVYEPRRIGPTGKHIRRHDDERDSVHHGRGPDGTRQDAQRQGQTHQTRDDAHPAAAHGHGHEDGDH